MRPSALWTREQIATRILHGDTLIIFHGELLSIPQSWLDAHPGGALALLHFVGRDATDEIEASHQESTIALVQRYTIGRVSLVDSDDCWAPFVPPVAAGWVRRRNKDGRGMEWFQEAVQLRTDGEDTPIGGILLQENHARSATEGGGPTRASLEPTRTSITLLEQARQSRAYRALHKRIADAGLYETRYVTGYGPDILRYVLLAALAVYFYRRGWFMTSAVWLGLFWHQMVFCAHDLGHMGVTHNWTVDRIIGTVVADFIGGASIGWWVQNHSVHHLVTNHPSHDPDIEHMPFFAISPVFLESLWSTYYKKTMTLDAFSRLVLSVQHKLFYVVLAFGRLNLYVNSYIYLYQKYFDTRRARGGRWAWRLEIAGIIFYWCWYGRVLYFCGTWQRALAYFLVSHAVMSPLHVQLVLSHFSMPTDDLGPAECFAHRQLRTTSDVTCDPSIEFLHGGLHLQVTHHLFPRLPRHNLRRASALVKEFALEHGLEYHEFGFVAGNREVLGTLRAVAEQVKLVGCVARAEVNDALAKRNR